MLKVEENTRGGGCIVFVDKHCAAAKEVPVPLKGKVKGCIEYRMAGAYKGGQRLPLRCDKRLLEHNALIARQHGLANADKSVPVSNRCWNVGDLVSPLLPWAQFAAQLSESQGEEIARGMTLSGPQRDELRLMVNGHDLGLYGSRGQVRTGVMALKLAELAWMRDTIGEWPILLLDEVVAELDANRRAYLLNQVNGVSQALLTTTEPDIFTAEFLQKASRWHVRQGQITSSSGGE